jgi:hypothetical protein
LPRELERRGARLAVLDQKEVDTTTRTGMLLRGEGRRSPFRKAQHVGDADQEKLRREFVAWKGSKAVLAEKHGISRATLYRIGARGALVPSSLAISCESAASPVGQKWTDEGATIALLGSRGRSVLVA